MKTSIQIRDLLESKFDEYNRPSFISSDPISIPHQFERREDIEVSAFLTAIISWGRRDIIIRNANRLMDLMGRMPFEYIMTASNDDLDELQFVHRTFQPIDCCALILGLRNVYTNHGGLEKVFASAMNDTADTHDGILNLREKMSESASFPARTFKHLANPAAGASAKRINMFLRWMVRKDKRGVDFGIWESVDPAKLVCPLDVHTGNVGRRLGLLTRKANDWKSAMELTGKLREFDSADPVKYDFALFGLGIFENF